MRMLPYGHIQTNFVFALSSNEKEQQGFDMTPNRMVWGKLTINKLMHSG